MLTTKDLISVSNGSACTSSTYEPSHVIKSMTEDDSKIKGAIRVSWCHLTNNNIPIEIQNSEWTKDFFQLSAKDIDYKS